jgi:hypothetical protein
MYLKLQLRISKTKTQFEVKTVLERPPLVCTVENERDELNG